jgi:hypothetical protein
VPFRLPKLSDLRRFRNAQTAVPTGLETVPNLAHIGGGASTDGKAIVLVCTLADGTISKFGIPLVDIQLVIGHTLSLVKQASELCSEAELQALPDHIKP